MSREPHSINTSNGAPQRYAASNRGAPYQRNRPLVVANGANTPVPQTESSSRGPRRLTFNNFATFNPREKKLPPDANTQAALNTKLWQLPERASFYCNKCRRDNIISDSLGVDAVHHVMLCTRCFTRIIRPRTYRPSRVVPFPSLLSWLNYKPLKVMEMTDDVVSRPAEAVAPSGERIAVPTLGGGDRPTRLQNLPAIAMNTVPSSRGGAGSANRGPSALNRHHQQQPQQQPHQQQQQQLQEDETHPCRRVWGSCVHGETCLFRGAPYDLCICFLMGLCSGDDTKCRLLHQRVFDLPSAADPMPAQRGPGDLDDPQSEWSKWMAKKMNSPNSAEWQLWNNGPVIDLINVYAPVTLSEKTTDDAASSSGGGGRAAIKLNFADISAALRGLKQ
ncbi:putative RNA-binding protein [Trypanosoma theileri]|uniref:Putative RNA-binding protein n=1 Tax=Trypanosoma theileri TaxID=67003 RepID=A0A1X0P9A0_9TRYP|nr:putative RNA-binding protein [Trypanosoma theileri]ORC93496.1 putative RNA-binding protein [Trypanosoma theileri]